MTIEQLITKREEICYLMVEADSDKIASLEQELMWIEELLNEQLEAVNEEEGH